MNDICESIFYKVKTLPESVVQQDKLCQKWLLWKIHTKRTFLKTVDGSCAHSMVEKTRVSHLSCCYMLNFPLVWRQQKVIPWLHPITGSSFLLLCHSLPGLQVCCLSCMWGVLLSVSTDIPLTKNKLLCEEMGRENAWGLVSCSLGTGVSDGWGSEEWEISYLCYCRKLSSSVSLGQYSMLQKKQRHTEQNGAMACCDTTATCHPGKHFCPKYHQFALWANTAGCLFRWPKPSPSSLRHCS